MKLYSLKPSWLIEKIMRKGKVFKTPFFVCKYQSSPKKYSEFCYIVSAKVSKKAVERNRIRRRLQAATRKHLDDLNNSFQAVIIGKEKVLESEFREIENTIKFCFDKLDSECKVQNAKL